MTAESQQAAGGAPRAATAAAETAHYGHGHHGDGKLKLAVGAIGVVFGDIGTSPLYAFRETFAGHHPLSPDAHPCSKPFAVVVVMDSRPNYSRSSSSSRRRRPDRRPLPPTPTYKWESSGRPDVAKSADGRRSWPNRQAQPPVIPGTADARPAAPPSREDQSSLGD